MTTALHTNPTRLKVQQHGDIWTLAGGKDYAGKPRPVVILQEDSFDATDSITICAFTTDRSTRRSSA